MYAKLIEGRLVYAPAMLRTEQGDIYNPTEDVLASEGYKPVIGEPYPEVDEESPVEYAPCYEETEDTIIQTWKAAPSTGIE